MFETLLASKHSSGPWSRPAVAAVLMHAGAAIVALAGTSAPELSSNRIPRDTIRLELLQPLKSSSRSLPPASQVPRAPSIPLPPNVPHLRPEPLRLDWTQQNGPAKDPVLPIGPLVTRTTTEPESRAVEFDSVPGLLDVDRPPDLVHAIHPQYPEALRGSGAGGAVELEYVIGASGRVEPSSFRIRASPHPAFSRSAVDALRGARFRPALRRGRPVAVRVWQTIRFVHR